MTSAHPNACVTVRPPVSCSALPCATGMVTVPAALTAMSVSPIAPCRSGSPSGSLKLAATSSVTQPGSARKSHLRRLISKSAVAALWFAVAEAVTVIVQLAAVSGAAVRGIFTRSRRQLDAAVPGSHCSYPSRRLWPLSCSQYPRVSAPAASTVQTAGSLVL